MGGSKKRLARTSLLCKGSLITSYYARGGAGLRSRSAHMGPSVGRAKGWEPLLLSFPFPALPACFRFPSPQAPRIYFSPSVGKNEKGLPEGGRARTQPHPIPTTYLRLDNATQKMVGFNIFERNSIKMGSAPHPPP